MTRSWSPSPSRSTKQGIGSLSSFKPFETVPPATCASIIVLNPRKDGATDPKRLRSVNRGPSTKVEGVAVEVGAVGDFVGPAVGAEVGPAVGAEVGSAVGPAVGAEVGAAVGADVGQPVNSTRNASELPMMRVRESQGPQGLGAYHHSVGLGLGCCLRWFVHQKSPLRRPLSLKTMPCQSHY